jgi:phospholipid/cholesterol/gamma-HCH transport system substrate-binding protein
MKEHTRNVAVGLTVLVALTMFGGMILMFAGLPELLQTGRVLKLKFPSTGGARVGEWVYMSGIQIGKITSVKFAGNDPRQGVIFSCRIDSTIDIPANIEPKITSHIFGGGTYLELTPTGPARYDKATGKKLEYLPRDWPEPLEGRRIVPSLLPDELTEGFKSFSKLADSLNSLVAAPAAQPASRPGQTQPASMPATATLGQTLASFKQALDDLHEMLGQKDNQDNFKKTLAGLADAAGKASASMDALKSFAETTQKQADKTLAAASQAVEKVGTLAGNTDRRIGEISGQIVKDAEQLSKVLDSINRIATKMDSGEGTIPKLLNDPKLYDNFLQASKQLSELAAELRVLVRQWEKEGIPLKVK